MSVSDAKASEPGDEATLNRNDTEKRPLNMFGIDCEQRRELCAREGIQSLNHSTVCFQRCVIDGIQGATSPRRN